MKKILFIYPPFEGKSILLATRFPFPIGLLYIAAYLKSKGIRSTVLDLSYPPKRTTIERPEVIKKTSIRTWSRYGLTDKEIKKWLEKNLRNYHKIIGLGSLMSTNYLGMYNVAKIIKKIDPERILIAGGPHATADPDHVFANAPIDLICIGEGEEAMYNLLIGKRHEAIIKRSKIKRLKRRSFIDDMNTLPFPKRKLLKDSRETKSMYVTFSRGCPHNCRFCGSHLIQGRRWRHKSVDRAIDEMIFYIDKWGVKKFIIEDDNLCPGEKGIRWLKELCKRIASELPKIKLTISHGIPVYATADKELCNLMWEAGFRRMVFPLESTNTDTLKDMRKEGTVQNYIRAIKNWDHEKKWPTEIIIGYPFIETIKTMLETIIFIANHGGLVWASHFRLNKDTQLFEDCLKAGYIGKEYDTLQASTYCVQTERFDLNDLREIAQIGRAANFGTEHGWNCFADDPSTFISNDYTFENKKDIKVGSVVAKGRFGYNKGQNIFTAILVLRMIGFRGKPTLSVQDKNKIIYKKIKHSRVWNTLKGLIKKGGDNK